MYKLSERFPEKHRLIILHLHNGESFLGAFHSGGSGIGAISGENTEHYFEDGDYDEIDKWEYELDKL